MISNQLIDQNYIMLGQLYKLNQDGPGYVGTSELKAIIKNNFDINYKIPSNSLLCQNLSGYSGNTVLHFFATFCEDDEDYNDSCFKVLLKLGSKLNVTNDDGYTPLLLAFYEERISKVILLLQAHFETKNSTNFQCKNGISHFHVACSVPADKLYNIVKIVDFFLKSGADINERVNDNSPKYAGYTPLHFATQNRQVQTIEMLLNNGANINIKDAKGMNPLHILIIKLMKEYNLDKDIESQKCLMKAACNNQYDVGSWLLHLECISQDNRSVDQLLNQNVNIDAFIEFNSKICPGNTPLHLASHFNLKTVMLLLLHGANLLAKDEKGITPFDICLTKYPLSNIIDILKTEKQHQLSIIKFTNGTYLLDVLEAMTTPDKFKQFLSSRVTNVNTCIPFHSLIWPGFNLLHLGVLFDCYVPELLNHKADFTMINKDGSSPLHLAFCMGKDKLVVKILKAHKQRSANPINRDNLSHLFIACAAGNMIAAKLLLQNGANPNLSTLGDFKWIRRQPYYQCIDIKSGSTPLHAAVVTISNFELIKMLLDYDANPHVTDVNGETPFENALSNYRCSTDKEFWEPILNQMLKIDLETWTTGATGLKILHAKIVQKLLHVFDKKSIYEKLGTTRLHIACCIGDLSMVQKELESIEDVNWCISLNSSIWSGESAMHVLFEENPKQTNEIAELLLAHGADPTLKNSYNLTPIHVCHSKDMALQKAISLLGKKFTSSNPINNEGLSHFHLACKTTNVLVVKEFLESGVDINITVDYFTDDYAGWTPLHFAICYGSEDVVKLLLDHGADPKIMNASGLTPLHQAVSYNSSLNSRNRVENIIRHPAVSIHDMSIFGDTILMTALKCHEVNEDVVDLLLDKGAHVNLTRFTTENLNDSNFIFDVTSKFSSKIFQRLIVLIPYITITDDVGQNAFHHFGSRSINLISNMSYYKDNIEILLENGCELDQKDNEGFTALHSAVYFEDLEMCNLLLSLGADVNMKNDDGKTPIDIAFAEDVKSTLALHIRKLKKVGLYLEESNKTYLKYKNNEVSSNIETEMQTLDFLLKEKISPSFSANYFFTEQFVIGYRRMQPSRRQTILKFWYSYDLHKLFPDLVPLINCQLRKARTRTRLLGPVKSAFNELINFLLPDICLDCIFNYLNNDNMMNLIRAINGKLEFAPFPKNC